MKIADVKQAVQLIHQLVDCLCQLQVEDRCWCEHGPNSDWHSPGCKKARKLVRQAAMWERRVNGGAE